PFPDGRYLLMWQDQRKTCEEIAKFSRRDAARYPEYEEFIERLARFVEPLLLAPPPQLGRRGPLDLLELGRLAWKTLKLPDREVVGHLKILTQSVQDFLDPWFESEQLKVTLATDGVIGTNGGPQTPGTAYILLHHSMGNTGGKRGLWGFVEGGMGGVTQALAASARSAGAEIRTSAEVERILVPGERAAGVVLARGEEIRSRLVVSNADPKRTFLGLVGEAQLEPEFARDVKNIRMNGCSMKINLALDALPDFKAWPGTAAAPPHRTTIHICPDLEYVERAWDDSKYGRPSERPLLEITLPTTYDASLAPPGKHLMGIFLQYTPYHLRSGDWPALKEAYADRVLDLLEEYAPNIKKIVLHRQVLSPLDLEEQFGLTGGSIFHGDMSVDQLFFLRPVAGWARYRTPVEGLYLCGAGTHPGGGVMGAPGYNAAREILKDRRKLKSR
ncbi:MAG: phytoene desaturase family protein, partial [Gemmatimonadales bacterium]